MALAWQAVKWFLWLSKSGLKFDRTLTLGRMNFYLFPAELEELCRRFDLPREHVERHLKPIPPYSEPFFSMLGAREVLSMDASDYEGASIVHDLNEPIGEDLVNRFDVVHDGGTLEHVFNFPEGLRSAMRMVRVGGSLTIEQCFNNMVGHGFYCFGPDLFFRALGEENGFRVLHVHVYERYPRSPWYRVSDPGVVGERVRLVSSDMEVMILVHAVKEKDVPVFRKWPHQSDYAAQWEAAGAARLRPRSHEQERLGVAAGGGPLGLMKRLLLRPLREKALYSASLGRVGKRWLNRRNFTLAGQPHVFTLDDPFVTGAKATAPPAPPAPPPGPSAAPSEAPAAAG